MDYWKALDHGRVAPAMRPVDKRILRVLKNTLCVAELGPGASPYYHLIGESVAWRLAFRRDGDVKFSSCWSQDDSDEISYFFWQAAEDCRPFYYLSDGDDCFGDTHVFETLWLPLSFGELTARAFLGVSNSLCDSRYPPGPLVDVERFTYSWVVWGEWLLAAAICFSVSPCNRLCRTRRSAGESGPDATPIPSHNICRR